VGYGHSDYDEDDASVELRDRVDFYCERGILCLVLFILAYAPLTMGGVLGAHFALIEAATAAIMVTWGVRFWTKRHFRLFWPPICWAVFLFVLYAIVRCHFVDVSYTGRVELDHVIVYACLFFAILNNINRRETTSLVGIWLIILAAALSMFAFYQFATRYPYVLGGIKPPSYVRRGTGTFINPNNFAGFLAMIAPLALTFTLMGRFKYVTKALLGYALLVILAGVGVALSRGGIIAAGVSMSCLLILLLFRKDFRLQTLVMLIALVTLTIVFVQKADQTKTRFAEIVAQGKVHNDRFRYWEMATDLYKTSPVWGIGPGHYDLEFWSVHPNDLLERPEYVHNDYIQALCEWGIPGVAFIGVTIVLFGIGAFYTWPFIRRDPNELGSKKRNSTKTAFFVGGIFGLFAIAIHSFVDFNLHIPANAIVAITLLALVTAHLRFATERYWRNPEQTGRIAMSFAVVLAVLFLSYESWHKGNEGVSLNRAASFKTQTPERLACLMRAAYYEPWNYETCYAIGEYHRAVAWQGEKDYKLAAVQALKWHSRSMLANPYYPLAPMRYGMCLDWLDRGKEATAYFQLACKLHPKGNYVAAFEGWHYIQMENYEEARKSLDRSIKLYYNDLASKLMRVADEKLAVKSKEKRL
jgi:O-antigen ligase